MAQISGIYINLSAAELATARAEAIQLLSNLRTAHQSYSVGGRNVARVQMQDAQNDLAEINYAIALKAGTLQKVVYSDMSGG